MPRMLRANFDYPFVKFAMTDDDRPMLMTELPAAALDRDELGRGLARLAIVADRLLEETANAVADRGTLPDWGGRDPRNPALLAAYRAEVEAHDAGVGAAAPERPAPRAARCGSWTACDEASARARCRCSLLSIVATSPPGQGRSPRVAAAEFTMVTVATYNVQPDAGIIDVAVDVTFTNTTPDPEGQFSVFDEILLAVHDSARTSPPPMPRATSR